VSSDPQHKLYNNRKWREKHPEKMAAIRRRYLYGITQEEFEKLYDRQDGLCAICRVKKASHLDHDHDSGKIRGLLCGGCNRGLGLFEDSVKNLRSAINYLTGS
jgi:hypothetical protein